jgi:hypothetical protein
MKPTSELLRARRWREARASEHNRKKSPRMRARAAAISGERTGAAYLEANHPRRVTLL